MKLAILKAQDAALCFVSKWWRPITCIGIAGGAVVNLVVIPLVNWEVPNMAEGAAYVAAVTATFGVRAWEKHKGVARGGE